MQTSGLGIACVLRKRFQRIFVNCGLDETHDTKKYYPFDKTLYLIATILDPLYRLIWVDHFDLTANVNFDLTKFLKVLPKFKMILMHLCKLCYL